MENDMEEGDIEVDSLPQQLWVKICASIFEETLDQLSVLRKIKNMPETPIVFEKYTPIDDRFSQIVVPTIQEESRSREEKNVLTFEKNLAIVETAVKTTFEELLKNGTIEKLLDIIHVHRNLKSDEENLKNSVQQRRVERKKLEFSLYKEKIQYHKKFGEVMMDIGRVKDEIRNFILEGEAKSHYIKNWQNAKIEELDVALNRKEECVNNTLRRTEGDIFRETRINEEILLAVDEMKKELEAQIDMWKEKYNISTKDIEKEIIDLKQKKEKQQEKINKIKAIYSERQGHIDDYKLYKIEQERKNEELKRKNKAATRIEAWWRGVMVRKGFGRFRKKKEKKGKKGSSEKKEK